MPINPVLSRGAVHLKALGASGVTLYEHGRVDMGEVVVTPAGVAGPTWVLAGGTVIGLSTGSLWGIQHQL